MKSIYSQKTSSYLSSADGSEAIKKELGFTELETKNGKKVLLIVESSEEKTSSPGKGTNCNKNESCHIIENDSLKKIEDISVFKEVPPYIKCKPSEDAENCK